jgi:FixJ family two-component response regulator
MREANPSVLIVDDDPEFRAPLDDYCERSAWIPCLVVDVRMPWRSGLEPQRDLASANRDVPIIFITAHGDFPMTVRSLR